MSRAGLAADTGSMVPVTDQTAMSLLPRGMGGKGKYLQIAAVKPPDRNFGCFLLIVPWPWPLTYRTRTLARCPWTERLDLYVLCEDPALLVPDAVALRTKVTNAWIRQRHQL